MPPDPAPPERLRAAVPAPVLAVVDTLAGAGFPTYLVGGSLRDLLLGLPVHDFDLATAAPPDQVLHLFRRAVPTGIRHGTVMVPTSVGPVDVTTFRGGPRIEDDLARRDFTVNAIAFDVRGGTLADPAGGIADLAARRLRSVGDAESRFAEDPLRAVRAARFLATRALDADATLLPAMRGVRQALRGVARERLRNEIEQLLLGTRVAAGLGLLRESGIEADLAPGTAAHAGRLVEALPGDLDARLAGWLLGAHAAPILVHLRFRRRRVERIVRLVGLHPIDGVADTRSEAGVRRLLRRAGEENLPVLVALRRAELAVAAVPDAEAAAVLRRLDDLESTLARVLAEGALALRRRDLALSGHEVMEILGSGPGRHVGEALRRLTERVIEDPACNTKEGLTALLLARKS